MQTVAVSVVDEQSCGIWNRAVVAGVKRHQLLICHFIQGLGLSLLQVMTTSLFVFLFFIDVKTLNSVSLLNAIFILCGIFGILFGFLIATVSENASFIIFNVQGILFTTFFLSGLYWPIEAQPELMQLLSSYSPFTVSTKAVRNIGLKNASFDDFNVVRAFVVLIGGIVIVFGTIVVLIYRKKSVHKNRF
jgi:ABC-2 type transport system permease protein